MAPQVTLVKARIDVATKTVVPDPIFLSKDAGDEVEWSSTDKVTVHFLDNRTPFKDPEFEVPKNGSKKSGSVGGHAVICQKCKPQPAGTHFHYKYEIRNSRDKLIVDPEIIIKN
ncbi:MAG: hypothetical protein LAN83_09320 [Acidobacteriia bacterium]|nr:hypothetical protein [Terriglobia bacterium]